MPKLYIMSGLAFSGKSTLARKIAKHTGSKIVAFDKLWAEKNKEQPIPKDTKGWIYIRNAAQRKVLDTLSAGLSVVYDDNNPRREHRDELRDIANRVGVDSIVIYLATPIEVIRSREEANKVSQKRHGVEPHNFQKVLDDMEMPTPEENVQIFTPGTDLDEFLRRLK